MHSSNNDGGKEIENLEKIFFDVLDIIIVHHKEKILVAIKG